MRVEEDWVLDILRIYRSLLWRMADVTPHIAFIGRLFGPAGTVNSSNNHSVSFLELLGCHSFTQSVSHLNYQYILSGHKCSHASQSFSNSINPLDQLIYFTPFGLSEISVSHSVSL